MNQLPDMLRRLPLVFYILGAVFFVWNLANAWFSLAAMAGPYMDPSIAGMMNIQKSTVLYNAIYDAVCIVGTGGIIHVLIGIFDRIAAGQESAE